MKAIETEYKGVLFRSRLEARWAILFDALKLDWVYEPECFELSNGMKYTPDFYIQKYNLYIESKPNFEWTEKDYHMDRYKLFKRRLLVLSGPYPNFNVSALMSTYLENDSNVVFCPNRKYEPFFYVGVEDLGNVSGIINDEDYKKELNKVRSHRFYK